jgi:hypothetical protein
MAIMEESTGVDHGRMARWTLAVITSWRTVPTPMGQSVRGATDWTVFSFHYRAPRAVILSG